MIFLDLVNLPLDKTIFDSLKKGISSNRQL